MHNHICSVEQLAKELLILSEKDREWVYSKILDSNILDKLKQAVVKEHDKNLFFYTLKEHQSLVYSLISEWPASLVVFFLDPVLENMKLHKLICFEKLYDKSIKQATILYGDNKLVVAIQNFLTEFILTQIKLNNIYLK